ncbi:MAG: twin-arginine translocase subunit TatB, partial [Rhodospirillaceae bacterium]|nr:twin-arginine translocase subunit TatB [Rhodospirillaceae bacterium]
MLDIGWTEILVIAVVAIVVIGPKDLPRALRTVGQWVGKARAMSRDLQNSVNDMISE